MFSEGSDGVAEGSDGEEPRAKVSKYMYYFQFFYPFTKIIVIDQE